jgi:hypothetical protein
MNIKNTKAFMAHLPYTYEPKNEEELEQLISDLETLELTDWNTFDYLEETIQEYGVIKYLIGYENEPYEHFHFVVEFEKEADRNYHNFSKRVFKDKFKLRGQAKKGQPRQYGVLSKIDNIEKMCAYTLKEGNFRTNMSQEEIDKYIQISRDNQKTLCFRKKILKHLEELNLEKQKNHNNYYCDQDNTRLETLIKKEIIRYVITDKETNQKLTKSFIENIYLEYIQFYSHLEIQEKIDTIYSKFFSYI